MQPFLTLLACAAACHAASPPGPPGHEECDALAAAGLGAQILLPDSPGYAPRVASWWSASARLEPECILQPLTTADVATAVKTLGGLDKGSFAVRSGGHSHWKGGSSVHHGVTIDLVNLKTLEYDAAAGVARLGPSHRWGDVFEYLEGFGVAVVGGRDGNVGLGGFITGGGNSYHTGRHGFACDTVKAFEIVLADGSIVEATKDSHGDLFKALKGGSGNFGIVTRFDLEAFPAGNIWGGMRMSEYSQAGTIAQALVNFTEKSHETPEAAMIVTYTFQGDQMSVPFAAQVIIDTDGKDSPPVFDEILAVPAIGADLVERPMSAITNAYIMPNGRYNVWFTLSLKNDVRVIEKAAELHQTFVGEMLKEIPVADLVSNSLFQPIPRHVTDLSVSQGGNMLGLDKETNHIQQWLCCTYVKEKKDEPLLRKHASKMTKDLEAFAKSIDALLPWQYINYADPTQKPLASYGEESLAFMRAVSAQYDPTGVFQKMMSGGFRLDEAR